MDFNRTHATPTDVPTTAAVPASDIAPLPASGAVSTTDTVLATAATLNDSTQADLISNILNLFQAEVACLKETIHAQRLEITGLKETIQALGLEIAGLQETQALKLRAEGEGHVS